jgi:hypothetical protein
MLQLHDSPSADAVTLVRPRRVQQLPSIGACAHAPAPSHVSRVQTSKSSQGAGSVVQRPVTQRPSAMQFAVSEQNVSSPWTDGARHVPVSGTHTGVSWQTGASPHAVRVPPTHMPPRHASPLVHALASSHAVPSAAPTQSGSPAR